MISKIIAFGTKQNGISTRTADIIKGIEILTVQLYCLLKINNFEALIEQESEKEHFTDPVKLQKLKETIVRFGVEEMMRRVMKNPEKISNNVPQILAPRFQQDIVDKLY